MPTINSPKQIATINDKNGKAYYITYGIPQNSSKGLLLAVPHGSDINAGITLTETEQIRPDQFSISTNELEKLLQEKGIQSKVDKRQLEAQESAIKYLAPLSGEHAQYKQGELQKKYQTEYNKSDEKKQGMNIQQYISQKHPFETAGMGYKEFLQEQAAKLSGAPASRIKLEEEASGKYKKYTGNFNYPTKETLILEQQQAAAQKAMQQKNQLTFKGFVPQTGQLKIGDTWTDENGGIHERIYEEHGTPTSQNTSKETISGWKSKIGEYPINPTTGYPEESWKMPSQIEKMLKDQKITAKPGTIYFSDIKEKTEKGTETIPIKDLLSGLADAKAKELEELEKKGLETNAKINNYNKKIDEYNKLRNTVNAENQREMKELESQGYDIKKTETGYVAYPPLDFKPIQGIKQEELQPALAFQATNPQAMTLIKTLDKLDEGIAWTKARLRETGKFTKEEENKILFTTRNRINAAKTAAFFALRFPEAGVAFMKDALPTSPEGYKIPLEQTIGGPITLITSAEARNQHGLELRQTLKENPEEFWGNLYADAYMMGKMGESGIKGLSKGAKIIQESAGKGDIILARNIRKLRTIAEKIEEKINEKRTGEITLYKEKKPLEVIDRETVGDAIKKIEEKEKGYESPFKDQKYSKEETPEEHFDTLYRPRDSLQRLHNETLEKIQTRKDLAEAADELQIQKATETKQPTENKELTEWNKEKVKQWIKEQELKETVEAEGSHWLAANKKALGKLADKSLKAKTKRLINEATFGEKKADVIEPKRQLEIIDRNTVENEIKKIAAAKETEEFLRPKKNEIIKIKESSKTPKSMLEYMKTEEKIAEIDKQLKELEETEVKPEEIEERRPGKTTSQQLWRKTMEELGEITEKDAVKKWKQTSQKWQELLDKAAEKAEKRKESNEYLSEYEKNSERQKLINKLWNETRGKENPEEIIKLKLERAGLETEEGPYKPKRGGIYDKQSKLSLLAKELKSQLNSLKKDLEKLHKEERAQTSMGNSEELLQQIQKTRRKGKQRTKLVEGEPEPIWQDFRRDERIERPPEIERLNYSTENPQIINWIKKAKPVNRITTKTELKKIELQTQKAIQLQLQKQLMKQLLKQEQKKGEKEKEQQGQTPVETIISYPITTTIQIPKEIQKELEKLEEKEKIEEMPPIIPRETSEKKEKGRKKPIEKTEEQEGYAPAVIHNNQYLIDKTEVFETKEEAEDKLMEILDNTRFTKGTTIKTQGKTTKKRYTADKHKFTRNKNGQILEKKEYRNDTPREKQWMNLGKVMSKRKYE